IPILAVVAIGNSHSDSLYTLASRIDRRYSYVFTVLLYLTIGPLFAIPRCASTSFTVGIAPMLGNRAGEQRLLLLYSLLFFAIVLYCSLRPAKITLWIGKIINPIFLFFLFILLVTVFWCSHTSTFSIVPADPYDAHPLFSGVIEGYQTMDAIAGLAFGIVVVTIIRSYKVEDDGMIAKEILHSGVLTGALMGIIYVLTILMGAKSRGHFEIAENGGVALAQVSQYYLGMSGIFILAVIIGLACLKTSIGLVTSCAAAFKEMFPNTFSYKTWAVLFSVSSFVISNFGLSKIIAYSIPVLMLLYPLTMVLTILALFERFFRKSKYVYVSTTIFTGCAALLEFTGALPEQVKERFSWIAWLENVKMNLPLASVGLSWVLPAVLGFLLGYILFRSREKDQ
ncbi:MAG: branched-chain amino acid transport system II carrier protein, partial [Eubacteriales bacterium]|nr:branched-chain amino acid transport system II carrier protein [Eubacteriales bacterium]